MIQLGGKYCKIFNILIELGVPMKKIRLIKMYLDKMYSKVFVGNYLSETFPVQNFLKSV
jgi:hypothetical protein